MTRFGILSVFLLAGLAYPSVRSFKGHAYEPGSSTPAYSEHYEAKLSGGSPLSVRTEYRNASGVLITERTLDFSKHPYKPDYRLYDLRDGYEEGAEVLGKGEPGGNGKDGGPTVRVRMYVRDKREKPLREKVVTVPEPAVIDGGFNVFIKANWETLTAGKRVPFNFVAPARRDWFSFEAVPAGYDDASTFEGFTDTKTTRNFVVRPENKALRLLVPPIKVTYDVESRRMKEYDGISNVNNAKGKSFKIRIVYAGLGP